MNPENLAAPELSTQQRRYGHLRSLELRQSRARLKSALRNREVSIFDALGMRDAQGMKIADLLRAIPGMGPNKTAELLHSVDIMPKKTVRSIGPAQMARLVNELIRRGFKQ